MFIQNTPHISHSVIFVLKGCVFLLEFQVSLQQVLTYITFNTFQNLIPRTQTFGKTGSNPVCILFLWSKFIEYLGELVICIKFHGEQFNIRTCDVR